ncbi:molybdate ABC transporter substrate-binding protein [Acinetobacter schindleri]|uniref:molybdate ABC transporter substrate-binding protein n=1 Tax=Acinetobacter schindleri TaxID=108981 RepID=UPI002DB78063|nr:molybdate ABC transporter substrate-binding protein [Acinetobacter schindleri]MEB5928453.1 molybdate ABC transporter substrate-binding protein [Acinetobacter schindleri]
MKNIFFILGLCSLIPVAEAGTVRIYAAASLTNAVTDIVQLFVKQHPQVKVVPVFGASSALARQIEAGAPSDIFFSADQDWMNYLVNKQKIVKAQVKPLLSNQLVLINPIYSKQKFQASPQFNFAQSFQGPLCTGQMESVPVGKYAKQSLSKFNWLHSLNGRIVGTDNARAALALVERGECQAGIVYKTDALQSKKVKISGIFPLHSHSRIVYPIAVTQFGSRNADAIKLMRFMSHHAKAREIYQHYGFRF